MSRAKSRASIDTCGDCGLQGELIFHEIHSILMLCFYFFQMLHLQVLIEVSNQLEFC